MCLYVLAVHLLHVAKILATKCQLSATKVDYPRERDAELSLF